MFFKKILLATLTCLLVTSCGIFTGLTSNTSITPNNSFVLGNNKHGAFTITVTNVSNQPIEVQLQPLNGKPIFLKTLAPKETKTIKVKANEAVILKNNSVDTVNVDLKVKGDTGLSMGYSK